MANKPRGSPAREVDTEGRIQQIMQAMAELRWRGRSSQEEFAARFGISAKRLEVLSAEASRRLKATWDHEHLREILITRMATIGQAALERTEEVVDKDGRVHEVKRPDHRSALNAVCAIRDTLGLTVQKHEVTHRYEQMDDRELALEAARWLSEHSAPVLTDGEDVPPEEEKH
jgi:hypothetical protein